MPALVLPLHSIIRWLTTYPPTLYDTMAASLLTEQAMGL